MLDLQVECQVKRNGKRTNKREMSKRPDRVLVCNTNVIYSRLSYVLYEALTA